MHWSCKMISQCLRFSLSGAASTYLVDVQVPSITEGQTWVVVLVAVVAVVVVVVVEYSVVNVILSIRLDNLRHTAPNMVSHLPHIHIHALVIQVSK